MNRAGPRTPCFRPASDEPRTSSSLVPCSSSSTPPTILRHHQTNTSGVTPFSSSCSMYTTSPSFASLRSSIVALGTGFIVQGTGPRWSSDPASAYLAGNRPTAQRPAGAAPAKISPLAKSERIKKPSSRRALLAAWPHTQPRRLLIVSRVVRRSSHARAVGIHDVDIDVVPSEQHGSVQVSPNVIRCAKGSVVE
jgi:hypothetical protein